MALTPALTSFQTTFRKDLTPDLQVTDTTDYTAAGVNIADVTIFLKLSLVTSSGTSVIYDNLNGVTPDITPSISLVNTAVTPLPTTASNITFGTYTIEAKYVVVAQADVAKTYTYSYNWTPPTISISHQTNIQTSTITTIDTTDYTSLMTAITRAHTTYPPPTSGGSNLVSALATNVYQGIYTGTWSDKVVSTVTFTFSSGLIVIDEITGCIEWNVITQVDINEVLCCVNSTISRYEQLRLENAVKAKNMFESVIQPLNMALLYYSTYVISGCTDKAAVQLAKIIELTGCEDCNCDDGCSIPIVPLADPAIVYVVDSPDLSITVVPQTVGTTTTYHIQVSATLQNLIANIVTADLVSTDGSVGITSSTVGNVTTFNLAASRVAFSNVASTLSGNTVGVFVTQKSINGLANELVNNGDVLSIVMRAANQDPTYAIDGASNYMRLQITNNAVVKEYTIKFASYLQQGEIKFDIHRTSATAANIIISATVGTAFTGLGQYNLTGVDWTTNTLIEAMASTTVSEVLTYALVVYKFRK